MAVSASEKKYLEKERQSLLKRAVDVKFIDRIPSVPKFKTKNKLGERMDNHTSVMRGYKKRLSNWKKKLEKRENMFANVAAKIARLEQMAGTKPEILRLEMLIK